MTLALKYETISDIGKRRDNQDYCLAKIIDDNVLFVVADGLGAYPRSDLASKYLCEALGSQFNQFIEKLRHNTKEGIESLLIAANQIMLKKIMAEKHFSARTTCAIAYLNEQTSVFAHIGDTRIYRLNKDKIIWRSSDHSLAQVMVHKGELEESALNTHPARNILTRCLGGDEELIADIAVQGPLEKNEALLLCSDGFWENMNLDDLTDFYQAKNLSLSLESYVKKLNATATELDNMTAIFARMQG